MINEKLIINNNKLFNFHDNFLLLSDLVKKSKLPNSIIINGKRGLGKTIFANHIINFIFTVDDKDTYDLNKFEVNTNSKSYKLIQNNTHPNLYRINLHEGKNSISVDQIRQMKNFANKSIFNYKYKIIFINKSEYLNKNSSNALLKILEEPTSNTLFIILQNSQIKNLQTIQSRCIKFNLQLNFNDVIKTVNNIINTNVHNHISKNIITHYNTPGDILSLINFSIDENINLKDITLLEFIKFIISKKLYAKNAYIKNHFNSFLEKYLLLLTTDVNTGKYLEYYDYFIQRSNDATLFNLDTESIYINYAKNVLNE